LEPSVLTRRRQPAPAPGPAPAPEPAPAPVTPDILRGQAEDALRNGDLDLARDLVSRAVAAIPGDRPDQQVMTLAARVRQQEATARLNAPADAEDDLPPPPAPPPPVNPFVLTEQDRFSTFALEADSASYTLARRYIRQGRRPPAGVVRMEEFINSFDYHYPPQSDPTFVVHAEAAPSPFGRDLVLLKLGVRGKVVGRDGRKPSHLVYVIDASGSMGRDDRLPLVQYGLGLLLDQLDARDRVSVIAYGTQARLVLEAEPARNRDRIRSAIATVETGASTNLLAGIELGYQIASRHFRPGEINRVILCSDGVANVGPSDAGDLLAKVDMYRRQGITFTSVGVGAGSYDDRMLEQLANRGDGNYVFIDSEDEARRVFVQEMSATLQTIAKDVKIQVEFNPARVRRYRLIGYENRAIADKDFRNDAVDAGEIGSGQSATALYELELAPDDPLDACPADFGTVFVRYRDLATDRVDEFSRRLDATVVRDRTPEQHPRFFLAACVAEFAEVLRGSEHSRDGSLAAVEPVLTRVANALPLDDRVQELLILVQRAQGLP
jgi:Ca-activated chloride channel family protein